MPGHAIVPQEPRDVFVAVEATPTPRRKGSVISLEDLPPTLKEKLGALDTSGDGMLDIDEFIQLFEKFSEASKAAQNYRYLVITPLLILAGFSYITLLK